MTSIGGGSAEITCQNDALNLSLDAYGGSRVASTHEATKHSGLSALIDAAEARLCEVREADNCRPENGSRSTTSSTTSANNGRDESNSDIASSSPTATTPTMLPEANNIQDDNQSFLHVLMTQLTDLNNSDIITFLPDGKFFAIRSREFANDILRRCFQMQNYEEFLFRLSQWGFSLNKVDSAGIQIFRHPHFRRDHRDLYMNVTQPSSNCTNLTRAQEESFDYIKQDDQTETIVQTHKIVKDNDAHPEALKRRLSPVQSQNDLTCTSTAQKLKTRHRDNVLEEGMPGSEASTTTIAGGQEHRTGEGTKREELVRSLALQLRYESEKQRAAPLVEQALESATHSIVTEAIDTLLQDEEHSRETYLKHERALTKSAIPGVEPITKQLFAARRSHVLSTQHAAASIRESEVTGHISENSTEI